MNESMHEPLSWLLLERYALGELTAAERARVETRLAVSREDWSCLDGILNDLTELPPLPARAAEQVEERVDEGVEEQGNAPVSLAARRHKRSWLAVSSTLAVAAALALVFVGRRDLPTDRRYVSDGSKGGELALVVHGEQSGASSVSFAEGERFKLLVTCPSWLSGQLRVVLFQGGQRYEPLRQTTALSCGNHVPWPGAFSLDGHEPVDVCVSYGEDASVFARARVANDLEPSVVCTRLKPR